MTDREGRWAEGSGEVLVYIRDPVKSTDARGKKTSVKVL